MSSIRTNVELRTRSSNLLIKMVSSERVTVLPEDFVRDDLYEEFWTW